LFVALAILGNKTKALSEGTIVGRFEVLSDENLNVAQDESSDPSIEELLEQLNFDKNRFSELQNE
jgi:hypothetical protein